MIKYCYLEAFPALTKLPNDFPGPLSTQPHFLRSSKKNPVAVAVGVLQGRCPVVHLIYQALQPTVPRPLSVTVSPASTCSALRPKINGPPPIPSCHSRQSSGIGWMCRDILCWRV